jgi:hypothetical protein
MNRKLRIAILGSCVTRDAFGFFPQDDVEITVFVARTSFISLYSPPLPITLEKADITAETNFERNCIHADLFKTNLPRLQAASFDYLLLDLMEERHNLIKCGDTYILDTLPLRESGVIERLPPFVLIDRLKSATTKLWDESAARFVGFLHAQGISAERVILHESGFARRYRIGEEDTDFTEFEAHSYDKYGALLHRYHMHFAAALPGLHRIAIEPELLVGNGAHKWGRAPFHYIDAYYARFLEKFRAIVTDRAKA